MTTNDTETPPESSQEESQESQDPTFLDQMAGLTVAHQARAMSDLAADRCLLRRDMKARQNEQYGLGQDNLPECEDDMGVQVGDNTDNSKTIHNHYHNQPPDPTPHPHPPRAKLPWWLIALLVVPWIILATILVLWLLNNWNTDPRPPVAWELNIGAENPEPPATVQPVEE